MFSIPKQATPDNLLSTLEETVNRLFDCDIITAWFLKRRINDLRNAKSSYLFTLEQEERYKLLVNRYNAFTQYNNTDNHTSNMATPLIS